MFWTSGDGAGHLRDKLPVSAASYALQIVHTTLQELVFGHYTTRRDGVRITLKYNTKSNRLRKISWYSVLISAPYGVANEYYGV
jgi:hypothetical protein